MKLKSILSAIFLLLSGISCSQHAEFSQIENEFLEQIEGLEVPNLQINYVARLSNISTTEKLREQEVFFSGLLNKLDAITINELSNAERISFEILRYESKLNLERVSLEKKWRAVPLDESVSIYNVPNGTEWYTYLLKRWVDAQVKPEALFEFGLSEIASVKANMQRLQQTSGMEEDEFQKYLEDERFYFVDPSDVQDAFEAIREKMKVTANSLFPYINQIPEVNIARGTNENLAQVPGFYDNSTFFYNIFSEPFNNRQLGWFYAHEAIPGHHYQFMVNEIVERSPVQNWFSYPGFFEGWGAYVEYLGDELGFFETIYDEYGKWEWDLIRSVRVCIDIGLNYYGWTDEKALDFWKEHISNQDAIGVREINRMKRWPAQVISYKYGSSRILEMLEKAKQEPGFSFMEFHKKILQYGDLPISILEKYQG